MASRIVVSLFSGAGGLSSGFAAAGLCPALAVENNDDAVATYKANVSEAVINADIGRESERIIAEARQRAGSQNVFAVIGGPPCQGFSTAGNKSGSDPRNALIFSYFDIVAALNPAWFLFENVEGLLTSDSGNAVVGLAERFAELGYSFRIDKINFAQWGVPQARKRVLIVGNRHGIPIRLPPATHAFDGKKHRASRGSLTLSVGEAIAGLPIETVRSIRTTSSYASPQPLSDYDASMRTSGAGPLAHISVNFQRDADRIRMLKAGQSLRNLPTDMWPESFRSRAFRRVADGVPTERRGGAPAGLRRLVADHPALTITSFSSRELIHPIADRPLTLRECARLQTFTDSYDFHGGFQSVSNQIGNAFPPRAAQLIAEWLLQIDIAAMNVAGESAARAPAGLISYHLTDASQMSPALRRTDERLRELLHSGKRVPMRMPRRPSIQANLFETHEHTRLGPEDRKVISDGRVLGPIELSDRELTRLIAVILRDLGHQEIIPRWADDIPPAEYYDIDLKWFQRDHERPFDFGGFFTLCCDRVQNFRVIFRCITKLHRHRRKFELILRTQPLPTMEQVARRGLLEHGTIAAGSLASWLTWRKWIYDIDNRSAQETGYLFEPMLTESLGGRSVSARTSPVKRSDDPSKGRQVDCVVEIDGQKLAYEFKDRITIAASGQGRFSEELAFPRDCASSGYKPILMVMDPTDNPKLRQISDAFIQSGGAVFIGNAVWEHIAALSGIEIATFVKKYVKDPVESIALHENELLDLSLKYRSGAGGDSVEIALGTNNWSIPRPRRKDAVAIGDEDEKPE